MRDLAHLAVILPVFLGAAVIATLLTMPVFAWADGVEWRGGVAILWLIACYAGCMVGATRVIAHYRKSGH